jgi:hypothetical protein
VFIEFIFITKVLHPQFLSTIVKGSRPEKFFKVKSTNKIVNQEIAPWTQEKAPRECNVKIFI